MSDEDAITVAMKTAADEMVLAEAKALRTYYAAERGFLAEPTQATCWRYHNALSRFTALRNENIRLNQLGDAVHGPGLEASLEQKIEAYDALVREARKRAARDAEATPEATADLAEDAR